MWRCEELVNLFTGILCNDEGVPTILVTVGWAAWANTRAAAMESLPVSVCLWGVRLLFAWLLLSDLLWGLPVSHGDLLLVQCQGVGGQHCLATPTPRTALHSGLRHLHVGLKDRKQIHYIHNTGLDLAGIRHMASSIPYLINVIANKHLLFLSYLRFPWCQASHFCCTKQSIPSAAIWLAYHIQIWLNFFACYTVISVTKWQDSIDTAALEECVGVFESWSNQFCVKKKQNTTHVKDAFQC